MILYKIHVVEYGSIIESNHGQCEWELRTQRQGGTAREE